MTTILGIDYGSRKAGTTACFWNSESTFHCEQSQKNKDADAFILAHVEKLKPNLVAIDAPLSLPGVYHLTKSKFHDYHYRESDRAIGAMSPMFLGGLTARAMSLAAEISSRGCEVIEVYPAGLVKHLGIGKHYKKDKNAFIEHLSSTAGIDVKITLHSWHQVDAMLAWSSGIRWTNNLHVSIGDPDEGVICI